MRVIPFFFTLTQHSSLSLFRPQFSYHTLLGSAHHHEDDKGTIVFCIISVGMEVAAAPKDIDMKY